MFDVVLLSISTVYLDTLIFEANKHPPLATSPQPVGPSASSANSSTSHKPCTALYQIQYRHKKRMQFGFYQAYKNYILCHDKFSVKSFSIYVKVS